MRRIAIFLLLSCMLSLSQSREKRLVLKNGDYHAVSEWKVQGDRVHYYSTERREWEDVPNSLVDWAATEKYNATPTATSRTEAMKQADAEYAAALKEDEVAHPQVAPGQKLPEEGGVWLLDTYQDKPQLAELVQSDSKLNKQTGKNMLRAVINPIPTGSKMSIELPGRHARVESHVPQPSMFVNIDEGVKESGPPPMPPSSRWKIVRASLTKDGRVVSNLKINLLGHASESPDIVGADVERVNANWVKVTPAQPLTPGQYALVEMISPKEINMSVWDFGVNPTGPANPATRNDKKVSPLDNGNSRLDTGIEEPQDPDTPKAKEKKPKKR